MTHLDAARSSELRRAAATTVALAAIGSALALATSYLVGYLVPEISRDLRVSLGYAALVTPFLIALRSQIVSFGFRRERLGVAMTSGLVLALATLLGSGRWTVVATVPRTDHLTALLASAVVGFIEEGIFRGVLQTQLVAWLGRWRGLLLGAALFGLWHIPQRLLAGLRGTDLVASLVPVLVVGIVLGLFMLVVRNTVGPALLHTGLDWIERL